MCVFLCVSMALREGRTYRRRTYNAHGSLLGKVHAPLASEALVVRFDGDDLAVLQYRQPRIIVLSTHPHPSIIERLNALL